MIRKIFLFAALLLAMTTATAQTVGEWNIFTRFAGSFDDLIETQQKVYYTSQQRLFSFDKETQETYAYNSQNKLNDTNITLVKYNPQGKYLFIGYDTGNIDLLYDNGRVVNLSDIKDAVITYDKGINSVTFAKDRAYVGTKFGIVIFNDSKHEVVESGVYGASIPCVGALGDFLFIVYNGNLMYAPLNAHHNTISKFDTYKDSSASNANIKASWFDVAENGKTLFYGDSGNNNNLVVYTFDLSGTTPAYAAATRYSWEPLTKLMKTSKGNYLYNLGVIYFFNEDGSVGTQLVLPEEVKGKKMATLCNEKSVWVADAEGIANYDISGSQLTVLSDKFKPEGISTDEVFFIKFDEWGNVWTGNQGVTQYKAGRMGDYGSQRQALTRIVNGRPENMTLYDDKGAVVPPSTAEFAVDPENPDRYYQGTNINGLYVVEKDPTTGKMKQLHRFSKDNSPFRGYTNYGARTLSVKFDYEGNLWVGIWCGSVDDSANKYPANATIEDKASTFYVLPKETLRAKQNDFTKIVKSDWLPSKHRGIDDGGNKDLTSLICKHSPVMISFSSSYQHAIGITKTKGTWADPSDDTFFEYTRPVDQDGGVWTPRYVIAAAEDHRGRVWLAGDQGGIVEIADPLNTDPADPKLTRIKVPRNDGTNYADYLCETDRVYGIAVDNSNRKWIATATSGVYLVSENGDEILEHFTADNSPLPSNEVLSVACDPNSNTVYFGMLSGLVSYNSDSAPASDDYSNVYAYPNPVRPDYTGYITITGLMDNSLVKITDNTGRVVYQTRSEGGMAVWDGFDEGHNRAKSGVYYVFVSEGPNGGTSGAVGKIMIIR